MKEENNERGGDTSSSRYRGLSKRRDSFSLFLFFALFRSVFLLLRAFLFLGVHVGFFERGLYKRRRSSLSLFRFFSLFDTVFVLLCAFIFLGLVVVALQRGFLREFPQLLEEAQLRFSSRFHQLSPLGFFWEAKFLCHEEAKEFHNFPFFIRSFEFSLNHFS